MTLKRLDSCFAKSDYFSAKQASFLLVKYSLEFDMVVVVCTTQALD